MNWYIFSYQDFTQLHLRTCNNSCWKYVYACVWWGGGGGGGGGGVAVPAKSVGMHLLGTFWNRILKLDFE